jgi:hypothetical protein
MCGICGGQSDTGAGFPPVLQFLTSQSFDRLLHSHHLSSRPDAIDLQMASVLVYLAPLQPKKSLHDIHQVGSPTKMEARKNMSRNILMSARQSRNISSAANQRTSRL